MQPKVYLAGPVQNRADGGVTFRNYIESEYPQFDWQNPLDKYNFSIENVEWVPTQEDIPTDADEETEYVTAQEIVDGDKEMILDSDAILISYPEPDRAWGTPQEQMYVFLMRQFHEDFDAEIVVYHGDHFDVSPWLIHHSDFRTTDMDEAIDHLGESLTPNTPIAGSEHE